MLQEDARLVLWYQHTDDTPCRLLTGAHSPALPLADPLLPQTPQAKPHTDRADRDTRQGFSIGDDFQHGFPTEQNVRVQEVQALMLKQHAAAQGCSSTPMLTITLISHLL